MVLALLVAIGIGWVVFDIAKRDDTADTRIDEIKVACTYVLAAIATLAAWAAVLEDFVTRACS